MSLAVVALRALVLVVESYLMVFTIRTYAPIPFGLFYRKKPIQHKPKSRFAILVPAHNEELVIGALAENLLSLDYPKDLYDVCIIADNCTDSTAAVARAAGAVAYERHDPANKTKAFALKWMIEKLSDTGKDYDAVVVIDADNLVHPDYLSYMNDRLLQGERLIQGYLDVKNPFDTWISSSYAVAYWSTNRLWQLARYKMGLCAALGGTGMCIQTKLLHEIGWTTNSFTEDLDFQCRALLAGVRTTWCHEARIFDEKPHGLRASLVQRERWIIGHIGCMRKYFWPLLRRTTKRFGLASLDTALYLFFPFRTLIWLAMVALAMVQYGPTWLVITLHPHVSSITWWLVLFFQYYGLSVLGLLLEGAPRKILRSVWYYPLFGVTWIWVVLVAFLRRQKTWAHTKHVRQVSLASVLDSRKE